jgi:hypothetical protein
MISICRALRPKRSIDGGDLRLDCAFVGEEDACRAALDQHRRDRRRLDVSERLRGEDDADVFLPERFQPFLDLVGEAAVIERAPALVDDEQARPPVEARSMR